MFAYNCSPSFNWKKHLSPTQMEKFQKVRHLFQTKFFYNFSDVYLFQELGALGFKYQFITLAGFHANSFSMFDLARNYKENGMAAYSQLQEAEFEAEKYEIS